MQDPLAPTAASGLPFASPSARLLRRIALGLALILALLGLWARLRQYLAAPSYWYDEAYLLLNIFHKSYRDLLGPLTDDQSGAPLYLWSLRFLYEVVGPWEWVMRLPAFLAGLLALPLMFVVSRRWTTAPAWLWAIGLCLVSKHAIQHSNEVKPYAIDLLVTLLILNSALAAGLGSAGPRKSSAGLLLWALAAPWISLPSIFVLGGAGMALLWDVRRATRPRPWLLPAGFAVVCLLSFSTLWMLVLRNQQTESLHRFWGAHFADASSCISLLRSLLKCLLEIGSYGSNGLAVPLVLFAAVGAVLIWRTCPPKAILLVGPVALAIGASFVHAYPMSDRLVFFLLPCLWLLAAECIGRVAGAALRANWPKLLSLICLAALAAVLLPGAADAQRLVVQTDGRMAFRQAFDVMRHDRLPGDLLWVSHCQVYEVYYGKSEPCLAGDTPVDEIVRLAACRRLWLITAARPSGLFPPAAALDSALEAAGFHVLCEQRLKGVLLRLYGRPIQ